MSLATLISSGIAACAVAVALLSLVFWGVGLVYGYGSLIAKWLRGRR